jgi:hypothetical protein
MLNPEAVAAASGKIGESNVIIMYFIRSVKPMLCAKNV